jgi:hypothetical protein
LTRKTFEERIWELVTGHTALERIAKAMLSARATLQADYEKLHKAVLAAGISLPYDLAARMAAPVGTADACPNFAVGSPPSRMPD